MNMKPVLTAGALASLLAACASPDRVVFPTSSSIGFNVDPATNSASIAYDRVEGYIAPTYANGALPPVVASIASGGNVFAPEIRQLYATGDAARIATSESKVDDVAGNEKPLLARDESEIAFFGTATTLGLKVAFTTNPSLIFGYRRKEVSVLPLGQVQQDGVTVDRYPSVFASFDSVTNATELKHLGLDSEQFFATGIAAEQLANRDGVRGSFTKIAEEAAEAVVQHKSRLENIHSALLPTDGKTFVERRDALFAASDLPKSLKDKLSAHQNAEGLMAAIALNQPIVKALDKAVAQLQQEDT